MATEDPLRRLQILQRDLVAFTESRLANLDRLQLQLDASAKDLEKLLDRNRKNEASRNTIKPSADPRPDTLTIDHVQYQVRDEFREAAIQVADELDLDEMEAARLCIYAQVEDSGEDRALALRAMIRFHEQRVAVLDCLRLLLQLGVESDEDEEDDHAAAAFGEVVKKIVESRTAHNGAGNEAHSAQAATTAYWRKCVEGLTDIEAFIKKMADYRDKLVMTGQSTTGDDGDALRVQRFLLTRQHELLAAIMSHMFRGKYVQAEHYRMFLSKAATLESEIDIAIHYLPILISSAGLFGAEQGNLPTPAARELHKLFATGPAQLQWKQASLKAVATVCWLAEYSGRFTAGTNELNQTETERRKDEEARSELFFESLNDKAFHFMLAAAAFLKPVVWYDPARTGIVDFLIDGAVNVVEMPRASDEFSAVAMHELQVFSDAFVTNLPDVLRKLKFEEDEKRRNFLSQPATDPANSDLNLERFIVIMACAYQDDAEAARDFWADKESNLYGFLRWVSQRLPTPRVAAFCQLLRSIAGDDKSANQAHRFLLEDVAMTSGKLRKSYAVSWNQIFGELELYASNLKDRPAPPSVPGQSRNDNDESLEEPETGIMLDAYLGLAAHICRTSPEARNWLLKDQPFHLGEVMFHLARSALIPRVRACCLDMLAALLTDKVLEVRNGIWVLLDSWISSGSLDGSSIPRAPTRGYYPAKQYLHVFANNAEAGASLLGLLNALVSPFIGSVDTPIDALPFPENLGSPHRHAGIDNYVDFVMDSVFARKVPRMPLDGEAGMVDQIRYECLQFVFQCLSTFNEDLVLLANTTNVAVESAMETKSLSTYARLHPFARVMEWIFEKGFVASLFAAMQQNLDTLDNAEPTSPVVQATLKAVQVLNLAWKLQPTYLDIVKPIITAQASKQQVTGSTLISVDDVLLTHIGAIVDIAQFTASKHIDISLESIALFRKIGSSRKLTESTDAGVGHSRISNRLIGLLTPISTTLTLTLQQDFALEDWDLETDDVPLKLIKANATLGLLHDSLDASSSKPCLAHCLLGFNCYERIVDVHPQSAFASSKSLFHAIVVQAAELTTVTGIDYKSWLLAVKRGCLEIVLKLAVSPLTSHIVQPQLRGMDFLPALSRFQRPVSTSSLWDGKSILDPIVLLDSSAIAIRDFMHVREAFFRFSAADLRVASERNAFSVQEKIISALLGTINLPTGEQIPTPSIFDLLDFLDLETVVAVEPNYAQCTYFADVDLSSCTKDDPEVLVAFDINLVYELLTLRKRELKEKGIIKEPAEFDKAHDEIQAILASLTSQNNWRAIQAARIAALESWTELLSLVVTKGGLDRSAVVALSLQGLLLVLPKFEKSLTDSMEAAGLLAKLTLTFTHSIAPASHDVSQQTATVALDRLLAIFRVSLKVLTDSSTDLALRDVSYRTSCAVLASISVPSASAPVSSGPKQLLQTVQNAGDRLLTVVTEDAFSGRGITRVSALLFLDRLISLFQSLKLNAAMLKALTKLNFVSVLIDNSVGSIAAAFAAKDEMAASLAYYHTSLALLLRLCQTPDGTQLVLNSGFFSAIDDSKLFSTDPDIGLDIDNPTALKEFYAILTDLLRVITAAVISKGPQPGQTFLQLHRYTVQAIFKQAARGHAMDVADELSRLILATDFLEDDEPSLGGAVRGGFS